MRKLLTLLLIISLFFIHVSSVYAAQASTTNQKIQQEIVISSTTTVKKATPPTKSVAKKTTINKSSIQKRAQKAKLATASRRESNIETLLRRASSVMGTPYSYGSSGGGSFDCSGFTIYAFKAINVDLPRTSSEQAKLGVSVTKASLQKGDLVIFNNPANTRIGHVGIYVGDNNFIHASTSKGVTITSLNDSYYKIRYVGARRILN